MSGAAGQAGSAGAAGASGGGQAGSSGAGQGGTGPTIFCGHPSDCQAGQVCSTDGTCKPGPCTANPCIFGYMCGATGKCDGPADACDTSATCGAGQVCIASSKAGGACVPFS